MICFRRQHRRSLGEVLFSAFLAAFQLHAIDWQQQVKEDAAQDHSTVAYDGITPNKLVCDTTLREMPDGTWTLLMLAGDDFEPSPGNYTGITTNTDQGRTWKPLQVFDTGLPRAGKTVGQGPTELMILNGHCILFFSTHSQTWGTDWKSWMRHSNDAGKTWDQPAPIPGSLANFTFIRNHIPNTAPATATWEREGRVLKRGQMQWG